MDDTSNLLADTEGLVLVVDLDGTLVHTDMIYETFWSAVSSRWLNGISAVKALSNGKAALKRTLEELGPVDPAMLPYNQSVIHYVENWRQQGGRTALVSASDQRIVERVAAHLGLFDEVRGSDGSDNLKSARKAEYLRETYAAPGFVYIGDAEADLPVWRVAARAVTVDVPASLVTRVDAETASSEHLITRGSRLAPLAKAMRPHQWFKNFLVFLPLLAAHQFDAATIGKAILAFIAFSLIASSVYVLNDLLDLASDRAHPSKRRRPFASGTLPLAWGTWLAPGLLAAGFLIALFLGPTFVAVMAIYYAITTAYSLVLKRRLIVDICTLAGLYTLRIIAGGVATGIPLSVWLLAFSMFFFFSLAAMKRQAELVAGEAAGESKAHGRRYLTSDLPLISNMAVSSGYVSVLVMALYLNTSDVSKLYSNPAPLWGICLVLLFWLSRMAMNVHRGWMHEDPVVFAVKDMVSIICGVIIFGCAAAGALM